MWNAVEKLLWSPMRPAENWAQTLVRVAGNLLRWIIGLPIAVGLIGWGFFTFHSWWSDRPYRLNGLEGVEIGMTTTEVTLIKGAPELRRSTGRDLFDPEAGEYLVNWQTGEVRKRSDGDSWNPVASARNKTTGEILIDEGAGWVPVPASMATKEEKSTDELMRFDDLVVFLGGGSEESRRVYRVCLSAPRSYDRVIGVSGSDTEAEVTSHLGQPDSVKIDDDGLGKRSSFERYNLMIRFEKARVVGICVGT